MLVTAESRPRSPAERTAMATGNGPVGSEGKFPVPSFAGSSGDASTLKMEVLAPPLMFVRNPVWMTGLHECPTMDSGGQFSASHTRCVQVAAAVGLPRNPGGRCRVKSFRYPAVCWVSQPKVGQGAASAALSLALPGT